MMEPQRSRLSAGVTCSEERASRELRNLSGGKAARKRTIIQEICYYSRQLWFLSDLLLMYTYKLSVARPAAFAV